MFRLVGARAYCWNSDIDSKKMADIDNDKAGNVAQTPEDSFSETAGPVVNEKSLLRKIDAHLLPAVGSVKPKLGMNELVESGRVAYRNANGTS